MIHFLLALWSTIKGLKKRTAGLSDVYQRSLFELN